MRNFTGSYFTHAQILNLQKVLNTVFAPGSTPNLRTFQKSL